jgi:hypothetical protein
MSRTERGPGANPPLSLTKDDRETMVAGVKLPAPRDSMSPEVKALNRIAAALERLADVYLYVNDPEQEAQQPGSLSEVPKL